MKQLCTILSWEIWLLLGSLAFVVAYQLLTQRINMNGILLDKMMPRFSPGRVQLLVLSLVGAWSYSLTVLENIESTKLPEVPEELLLIVGGSNLIYLGGKIRLGSLLFRRNRQ